MSIVPIVGSTLTLGCAIIVTVDPNLRRRFLPLVTGLTPKKVFILVAAVLAALALSGVIGFGFALSFSGDLMVYFDVLGFMMMALINARVKAAIEIAVSSFARLLKAGFSSRPVRPNDIG